MTRLLAALAVVASLAGTAGAAEVQRIKGAPQSPILTGVVVPAGAATLYLSGQVPPVVDSAKPADSPEAYGDTRTQATGVLTKIKALLAAQGYGVGDVVKLTVFLAGDPKLGGRLDFKGFSEAYGGFFGTPDQPNLVARSTVQVAALVNPGFLVEIEAVAVKAK